MRLTLQILICMLAVTAAAHADDNLILNGDFSKTGDQGVPEHWVWRTRNSGVVQTHTDEHYVELFAADGAKDNFIQQFITLPPQTGKVTLRAEYRSADIVPGAKQYQRGQVQGRFLKDGKEIGPWISLAAVTGSNDWTTVEQTASVVNGADALMIRIALYGVKSGRLAVRNFQAHAVSQAELDAEAARYRPKQPFGEPVSDERYNRLQHGVSINNWFCQPWNVTVNGQRGGFNAEHFHRFFSQRDLDMIRQAGFDHIRLPIDPVFLMDIHTGEMKNELLGELDDAIAMILDAGLAVVIDAHPKTPPMRGDWHKVPDLVANYITWWNHFSKHLAGTDPQRVFIEPMNEPAAQGFGVTEYQPIQDRLFYVIRKNLPHHTLIAASGNWTSAGDLLKITDVHPDRNVIWTVHYYEPGMFTHQGAVWMSSWYHPLRNEPWPLTPDNVEQAIAAVKAGMPGTDRAIGVLRDNAARGTCTVERMQKDIAAIAQWSKDHDRRVIIGECGIVTPYAPRDSAFRYLHTLSATLKQYDIHWTQWVGIGSAYAAITDPQTPASRKVDTDVVDAMLDR